MSTRRRKFAVALAMLLAAPAFCGQTIPEALQRIAAMGDPGPRFSFVIIGDTRHFIPVVQPPAFKRAVAEINALKPDFVIDVGDLITGYTNDQALLKREWDEYFAVIEKCIVPWLSVVGNHDVSNKLHEGIWKQRLGPLRYSFTYGGCLFVCLNTEEMGWSKRLSPEQTEWFRAQLHAHRDARAVFVFMHQPLWIYKGAPSQTWEPAHQALAAHPAKIKMVFAGHEHLYRLYPRRDGVTYIITGGGGAELSGFQEKGEFHHYLLLTVKPDGVSWAVIRPGSILPENCVTVADVTEIGAKARCVGTPMAKVQETDKRRATITLPLSNPTTEPLIIAITWDGLAYCAKITPAEVAVRLQPAEKKTLTFELSAPDAAAALKHLVCVATMPYRNNTAAFARRLSVKLPK